MSSFNAYLKEQLKDPAVKAEYDALEPEFSIIQAMIDARKASGLTQKQLAEKTGIAQADISKLENGNVNPSLQSYSVWLRAWACISGWNSCPMRDVLSRAAI